MQVPKEATLNMGKKSITKALLLEVKRRLEKNKVVKVKILRSARGNDKKAMAKEISEKVEGKVIDIRGNTFTLKKNEE